MRISIQIGFKDRPAELGILLQSLRQQKYQAWDLVILDQSKNPLETTDFLVKLINRIMLEGHFVNIIKSEPRGVCYARNKLIKEDYFDNPLICRLDDDVIIEPDYLSRLVKVIRQGYDIASGVTPVLWDDGIKRNANNVGSIINEKRFDKHGNIIYYGDDCGTQFLQESIIESDEFRSCALMKKNVVEAIQYPTNLSTVGFREEAFFSLKARWSGFKIGVDVQAKAFHLVSPSGGVRDPAYSEKVASDNQYFYKWVKENYQKKGDFHNK